MDLQPWMAQLGLGAAGVLLFLTVGRSYVNYIGRQLAEVRIAHREELERLTELWKARLDDSARRGDAWETAAARFQQANLESTEQVRKLTEVSSQTIISILTAIREEQKRR